MLNYLSKVIYILGKERGKLVFILLSFIIVSVIEVIGIGLIGPFVSLSTNPEIFEDSSVLQAIYKTIGFPSQQVFVASIGFCIIFVFCLKSLVLWRVRTGIYSFSSLQQVLLRERLMNAYLEAPYVFHLGKNSSHIINNILSETFKFAYRVLNPMLELVANVFVVTFLIVLLSMASWITVLSVLLVFLPVFLLFNRFKASIAKWGKDSSEANQEIVRVINHGLGGLKETTVIGCGPYFKEQLVDEAKRFSKAQKQFYAFNVTPRIIIETLLVVFLIGLISCFLLLGKNVAELTALLSVFAIASMRLIPAATQITNGLGSLRNSSYTVNKLYSDLKELDATKESNFSLQPAQSSGYLNGTANQETQLKPLSFFEDIRLQKVSYYYPGSKVASLNQLSLTIKKGESIALIGQSGAGKTTLVDVVLGLLKPQSGDIKVDGNSIYDDIRAWQNLIGYIPQSIFLIEDSIERNVAFGVPDHLIDSERVYKAIEAAQLSAFVDTLPNGIDTLVGERGSRLSGGQRQRIGIARALYHEREILVLDEATAALDNETEKLVTESIQSLSGTKTMIIIAHRLTTVQYCDRICVMEKGQIIESGSYADVVLAKTS